jgi:ribosomal-protein-alanine N-acetyltransferase
MKNSSFLVRMDPLNQNNYLLEDFETERLRFRKLSWDDFDQWTKLFISDDVAIFLGLDPKLSKKELTQKWFDKTFNRYEKNLGSMNALIDKKTNRLIGQSGLLIQTIEDEQRLEVSYSILPEFWRQGFAYEAANACKNHAFKKGWSENLISVIEPANIGSERVAVKNGMTLEKVIIELHEAPFNLFSIQKENWLKTISND